MWGLGAHSRPGPSAGRRGGLPHRSVDEPCVWPPRGQRRAPRRRPRRGDRDRGTGSDPGADHDRRQSGAEHTAQRAARPGARRPRVHGQHRRLRERDDPPRGRDPAATVAAREVALRRRLLRILAAPDRQLLATRVRHRRRRARATCWRDSRCCCAVPGPTATRTSSTRRSSPGCSHTPSAIPTRTCSGATPASCDRCVQGESAEDRLIDAYVRTGPWGDAFGAVPAGVSLQALLDHPHGIDFGPLEPQLPANLRTRSAKVELAPPEIVDSLPSVLASIAPPEGLLMIGRRHLRSNNSWMHNIDVLMKGKERCTLLIHPDDAEARGLRSGDCAEVRSDSGHGDGARRGERRGDARRRVVAARLGSRRRGARLVGCRAATRRQHQSPRRR